MHAVALVDQIQYMENLSYVGLFVAVFLSGHLVPIPEIVILILTGYLVGEGIVKMPIVMGLSIIAILVSNMIFYYLSFVGAKVAVAFEHKIKVNIFDWYVDRMKNQTFATMFISRFIPGLGTINPIISGFIKISPYKFFFYSLLSALIYVPLFVFLGYFFHSEIVSVVSKVDTARHIIFVISMVVIGILTAVFIHRKFF